MIYICSVRCQRQRRLRSSIPLVEPVEEMSYSALYNSYFSPPVFLILKAIAVFFYLKVQAYFLSFAIVTVLDSVF